MNVVVFGKGFGAPRQVNFSGRAALGVATLFAGAVAAIAFGAGLWYSSHNATGVSLDEARTVSEQLAEEREAIGSIRQQTEDTLDALNIRLGQLNARVIRLDALGRRLTDMAEIDGDEFNFDVNPAMGGPEEPELMASTAGSAAPAVVGAMADLGLRLDMQEAQLTVLEGVLMGQNLNDRVYPQGRPVKSGWMSSYFGRRTDPFTGKPAMHRGVDFAGNEGDSIIAVADGVVTWSAPRYGYGEMVEINHGNGYATRYAHNAENLVKVGDEVRKGQTVALMGRTGRATGPNLHFEVLHRGARVNPVKFIQQAE